MADQKHPLEPERVFNYQRFFPEEARLHSNGTNFQRWQKSWNAYLEASDHLRDVVRPPVGAFPQGGR